MPTSWAWLPTLCGSSRLNALADRVRFLVYLMTYGTVEEIAIVRRYVDLDDFREALDHAPPGIMDERSWAYWNAVTGRYPAPPMPRRMIP